MRQEWLFVLPQGDPGTWETTLEQWLAADPAAADIPAAEAEEFVAAAQIMRAVSFNDVRRLWDWMGVHRAHGGEKGRRGTTVAVLRRWKEPVVREWLQWQIRNVTLGSYPAPALDPAAWTEAVFDRAATDINLIWLAQIRRFVGLGDTLSDWLERLGADAVRTYHYWLGVGRLTMRKLVYAERETAARQQEVAAAGQVLLVDELRAKNRQTGTLRHAVRRLEQDRRQLRRSARQAELKAQALLTQANGEVAAARRQLADLLANQAQELAASAARFEAELESLHKQKAAARAEFVQEFARLAATQKTRIIHEQSISVTGESSDQDVFILMVESLGGTYLPEGGAVQFDGTSGFLGVEQALRDLVLRQVLIRCDGLYRRKEGRFGIAVSGIQIYVGTAPEAAGEAASVVTCGPQAGSLMAEYGALVMGLRWLAAVGPPTGARLEIQSDCKTMLRRLIRQRTARPKPGCITLDLTARRLLRSLQAQGCLVDLHWVPRDEVHTVDRLCARTYYDQNWYHRLSQKTRVPLKRFMGSAAPLMSPLDDM